MKTPKILNPNTWTRYAPSLCDGCWAGCCTLPVQVSAEELFQLGYVRSDEVNGPPERFARRLLKSGIIQSFHSARGEFTLRQKNGADCLFLDEHRRCTVYENRPYICRQFPNGSVRPGFCPHQPK